MRMSADRINSSTNCSIWQPETNSPAARGASFVAIFKLATQPDRFHRRHYRLPVVGVARCCGGPRLFRQALSDPSHPQPRVINTDKARLYDAAIAAVKTEGVL